jgi:diketogulonate reductase-like aldo/keto reductase
MSASPTVPLARGVAIPQLGFGLYKVPPEDAERVAGDAIAAGYRSLDTAAMYGNEAGVGRAVRRAMSDDAPSGPLDRTELFITTKIWNTDHGYDAALRAFGRSQAELGLDVVDLCLIHWPCPRRDLYVETYRALIRLREDGRVRAVGVSNFQPEHVRRLLDATGEVPAVNQVELHPWLQQRELRALHAELGIATEAWSPLARGHILEDPVLRGIAEAHGVSVAQVVIRWHLQLQYIVIPKSATPARIAANFDVFDFELSPAELAQISGLNKNARTGPDPDNF